MSSTPLLIISYTFWMVPAQNGLTALMVASIGEYLEVIKALLAAGTDVNAQDNVRGG